MAAMAWKKARKSAPVWVGKKGVEWATMSVCLCGPSWKRRPKPRGEELGLESGMLGMPVELEKRAHLSFEVSCVGLWFALGSLVFLVVRSRERSRS